jgi:hypothetical protein
MLCKRLAHLWRRRAPARARLLVIDTDTHGAVWSPMVMPQDSMLGSRPAGSARGSLMGQPARPLLDLMHLADVYQRLLTSTKQERRQENVWLG